MHDRSHGGDHLAQRLRLPARPVVALSAALQRIHTFGEIWTEIARARRVRGIGASPRSPLSLGREAWALTIGMLVRSLQAAAGLCLVQCGTYISELNEWLESDAVGLSLFCVSGARSM